MPSDNYRYYYDVDLPPVRVIRTLSIGLIQSVFTIYNFIRRNCDEFLNAHGSYTRNGEHDADERDTGNTEPVEADDGTMKKLRDDIATAMWVDYLVTLAGSWNGPNQLEFGRAEQLSQLSRAKVLVASIM
ncbi:hypothetical protein GQ600_9749 [Phytophthora cactorum]|nr:hypothetical protein GQ600_9749 [Phytophthora cactorum]